MQHAHEPAVNHRHNVSPPRMTSATTTPTAAAPQREPHCPLCGESNGCVPAADGTFDQPCWCAGLVIDRSVLARVPVVMKGRACLCPRCAAPGRVDLTVKP